MPRAQALLVAGLAVAVAVAATWRLQLEAGTVGLMHDWSIFPDAGQNAALASQIYDGWYKWNLGEPATFPTEYPLRFLFGVAGAIGVGGDVLSHIVVFAIPLWAFLSGYLLARVLTESFPGALAAGAFYALNPVVLNKMVSGQTSYLVAYCVLPLVVWAYLRAARSRALAVDSLRFGAFVALAAIQLQLGVLSAFLCVVAAFTLSRDVPLSRCMAVLAVGFMTALAVHAPTVVALAGGLQGLASRPDYAYHAAFLELNSIPFRDVFRLIGYVTHYDTIAISQWFWPWNIAMIALIGVVAFGLYAAPASFRAFAIVAGVPVVALMGGTYSPFSFAIRWLFEHAPFMQAFRELYHLMAAMALIYALAIAFAFKGLARVSARPAAAVFVWLCIIVVSVPMLTGDAAGWMSAFPIGQAYGDVLRDQSKGDTRALWLPMDQPVSFRYRGAGVDPMSVTARGSLWYYSLDWPLTAIDTRIRLGGGDVVAPLQALGVGDLIYRQDMESQLARFTIDPIGADRFFSGVPAVALRVSKHYRLAQDFKLRSPIAMETPRSLIAFVPQRIDVCSAAIARGYAPMTFDQARMVRLPYAFFYDSNDVPEEAVELAGARGLPPSTSVDARKGFAPGYDWWWHRPEYSDVPALSIAFNRQNAFIPSRAHFRHAVAVLAWVTTPVGGRLRIGTAVRSAITQTNGEGGWASSAIPLGDVRAGAAIEVSSLDNRAEVAIRGLTLMEENDYRRMYRAWLSAKQRAVYAVDVTPPAREVLLRAGASNDFGYFDRGVKYRLVVNGRAGFVVEDANTVVARGISLGRRTETSVAYIVGTGERLHTLGNATKPWRLYRVDEVPPRIRRFAPPPRSRVFMWNSAYSSQWQTATPSVRLPSALGATIFVLPAAARAPIVFNGKGTAFHAAYIFGCLILLSALLARFTTVRVMRIPQR